MADERQALDRDTPWWAEHVHRYLSARERIPPGSTVLDIACGTGYGTDLLASDAAALVVGGDLVVDEVRACGRTHRRSGLAFAAMDGTRLPFRDETFDAVVSFETIEHTTRYREFAAELRRVLRDGGVACISTPNVRVTSPDGVVRNPFHTQEFTAAELASVLEEVFADVQVFGQRFVRYQARSGMRATAARALEWLLYRRGIRKLPLRLQDALMRAAGERRLYPLEDEYALADVDGDVEAAPTLFAVCR